MKPAIAGMFVASALLLAPCLAGAQTSSSRTSPSTSSSTVETMTIGAFLSRSGEAQDEIVFNTITVLMNNLGSLTDSTDARKPPEMVRAHQRIFDILREHFFSKDEKVFANGLTAFDRLTLDIETAGPEANFNQVFMNHIRKVIADYERAQNNAKPTGG